MRHPCYRPIRRPAQSRAHAAAPQAAIRSALGLLVWLTAACSNGGGGGTSLVNELQIVGFSPEQGSWAAEVSEVTATFSDEIDATGLPADALVVRDAAGAAVAGTVSADGNRLRLAVAQPLPLGTYSARLRPDLRSRSGRLRANAVRQWSFEVRQPSGRWDDAVTLGRSPSAGLAVGRADTGQVAVALVDGQDVAVSRYLPALGWQAGVPTLRLPTQQSVAATAVATSGAGTAIAVSAQSNGVTSELVGGLLDARGIARSRVLQTGSQVHGARTSVDGEGRAVFAWVVGGTNSRFLMVQQARTDIGFDAPVLLVQPVQSVSIDALAAAPNGDHMLVFHRSNGNNRETGVRVVRSGAILPNGHTLEANGNSVAAEIGQNGDIAVLVPLSDTAYRLYLVRNGRLLPAVSLAGYRAHTFSPDLEALVTHWEYDNGHADLIATHIDMAGQATRERLVSLRYSGTQLPPLLPPHVELFGNPGREAIATYLADGAVRMRRFSKDPQNGATVWGPEQLWLDQVPAVPLERCRTYSGGRWATFLRWGIGEGATARWQVLAMPQSGALGAPMVNPRAPVPEEQWLGTGSGELFVIYRTQDQVLAQRFR